MLVALGFALPSVFWAPTSPAGASTPLPGNVLIVIADDLGVDMVPAYGEGTDLPVLPTIDSLAASGVLFRNAYANPVCSPTRACIMTGRYAFRTGIGVPVVLGDTVMLSPAEVTIPEMLDQGTNGLYAHGAFGKWHLHNVPVGGFLAPNGAGWSHFEGSMASLQDYYSWQKIANGTAAVTTTYATTDTVDSALAWIGSVAEPWACYLAFNAPHKPWHAPPAGLFTEDLSVAGPPETDPRPYYKAATEALDSELGRLLAGLDSKLLDRTTVILIGDNGTPKKVIAPPADPARAKGSPFEGGINVPLIVSGPLVKNPGSECAALVHAVDLFATVADIAGVDLAATLPDVIVDGSSLVPFLEDPALPTSHACVLAEEFFPNTFEGAALPTYVCQQDLGMGGPGDTRLSVCGQPLWAGNTADFLLTGGAPNCLALVLGTFVLKPVPVYGGSLVPSPYYALTAATLDAQGGLYIVVPGGFEVIHGHGAIYSQVVSVDPSLPLGWSFSNVVKMEFPKAPWADRAIRNAAGYKYITRASNTMAGPVLEEHLYDLCADPLESQNLLEGGSLTSEQQAALTELKAALGALLATHP